MIQGEPNSRLSTRERILDAAERLMALGKAAFSMRELADEADLSFATPFNQFGSKAAITLALSARRIAEMHAQLAATDLPANTTGRVLRAVEIAASVMLANPTVNRAVMGAIGAPSAAPGHVSLQSIAYWAAALGEGKQLATATRAIAIKALPAQLAIAFRGVLSFWTAGELTDGALIARAQASAAAILMGFCTRGDKASLLHILQRGPPL